MWHIFIVAFLLGLGAAAPIGPINIEMIRRSFSQTTAAGWIFGLGACTADISYMVLLSLGATVLLSNTKLLTIISVIGALILLWFGWSAIRMHSQFKNRHSQYQSYLLHYGQGFFLTLFSPYNILFWAAVSPQVALLNKNHHFLISLLACAAVAIGILLWNSTITFLVRLSKKLLSDRVIHYINLGGGVMIIAIAIYIIISHVIR